MRKIGILYDNISGNTGDQAIGITVRQILTDMKVEFEELVPGRFNPVDYRTIIIGGGYLLQPSPNFFYDKYRVVGQHILNCCGVAGSPNDLEYLDQYAYISVRSKGDKQKLAYLSNEVKAIPCTTMLLEDASELPIRVQKPSVGFQLWEGVFDEEKLVKFLSNQPFHTYFLPITHYNRDYDYLARLSQKVKNSSLLPILKPQQISALIGKFDYFITGSLHGAIFAYKHNVPFALLESQDKQTFFMQDRKLDAYLFKNMSQLEHVVETIQRNPPDYSGSLRADLNLLEEHIGTIKDLLPANNFIIAEGNNEGVQKTSESINLTSKIQEGNFQIGYLQLQVENMSSQVKHLRKGLLEKSNIISEYNNSLQAKNVQIDNIRIELETQADDNLRLSNNLLSQQSKMESLNSDLESKERRVQALKSALESKEKLVEGLNHSIENNNSQILAFGDELEAKENRIGALESEIELKRNAIGELNKSLQLANNNINNLELQLQRIEHGIPMQLRNKYQRIIEKLLPRNTRRRRAYQITLTGLRVIINDGWRSFFRKAKNKALAKRTSYHLQTEAQSKILPQLETSELELRTLPRNLSFPEPVSRPDVSIVIPVYNKWQYTVNCLNSICKNTEGDYEVIVVDDASTDETVSLISQIENLHLVRNKRNSGFVDTCNSGARASKSDYILFLNNDTMVTRNWLPPLLTMIKREGVGAVGSKLVYPNGTLQEAGAIIWNDGSGWNYGRGDDPEKPEYNYVREVDYCSGASLLVKKDLFEKVGGFDERFKPGYCEDSDLCFTLRKMGYKVIYQPLSSVVHFEGITSGTDISSGIKKYQEINKSKFIEKWKTELQRDHLACNPDNAFLARDRSRTKKIILIIDDMLPEYDQNAGALTMYEYSKLFVDMGYKVVFVPDN
jgi:GT2 family glycosyltransferase